MNLMIESVGREEPERLVCNAQGCGHVAECERGE